MIFTVAIDGPAAAGKGTISRAVAARFGFAHLDTGLLYRAVGCKTLQGMDPVKAALMLDPADLDGDALRTAEIAQSASQVAALPAVRQTLVEFQRNFARREGGAVLDGRDIGTVICPEAEVKLFVTASDTVRADRRFQELAAKGAETDFDTVLADVRSRDKRDREREASPMRAAEDALILDTSDLSIDAAVAHAVDAVLQRLQMGDG